MIRTIKNNIAVLAVAFIFSVPAVSFAGGPIQPSGSKSRSVVRTAAVIPPSPGNILLQDLTRIIKQLKAMSVLKTTPPAKPADFTLIANKLIANRSRQVAFKFTGDACGFSGLMCPDFSGAGIVKVTISGKPNILPQTKIVKIDRGFVGGNQSMDVEIRPGDKLRFKLVGFIRLNSAQERV